MDFYVSFVAAVLFAGAVSPLGAPASGGESGPCMIRRKRLPRLDSVRVAYVRLMALVPGEKPYTVTTLSVRPPIFEIHNFLSERETTQLLQLAENEKLENSDVFHHSMDMMSDTVFEQWDLNSDDIINFDEVISGMRYIRDLHFTENDVQKMFNTLKIGKVMKGAIHRSEFQPLDITTYIEKLRTTDFHVKGRHSNHTFIDGPGYEQIAVTLDVKKAALTGMPIEIIKGSETPSAVKYDPGGHYHCHYDSHQSHVGATCCDRKSLQGCRICRYITILYFLNDVEDGGQTAFPVADNENFSHEVWPSQTSNFSNLSVYCSKANLQVTPKRGNAIMWYNHMIDDTTGWIAGLDLMSYHGGCDVKRGHKWIVNNWINIIGQDWDDLRTWDDKDRKVGKYTKAKEGGKIERNV